MKREPLTSTRRPAGRRRAARRPAPRRGEVSGAGAERRDRFRAQVAERVEARHAALARVGADLAMERRSRGAHFAHVAHHQPARARRRREHVDRGAHRVRIRVVGVVEQQRAAVARSADASRPGTARNTASPAATADSDTPAASAGGRGGERVARHVPSGHAQRDLDAALRPRRARRRCRRCGASRAPGRRPRPRARRPAYARHAPAPRRATDRRCASSALITATPSLRSAAIGIGVFAPPLPRRWRMNS